MTTVTIHDAEANLSDLLRRVEAGEEIVIARDDKPVAVLQAYDRLQRARLRREGEGSMTGRFAMPPDDVLVGALSEAELGDAFGKDFVELLKSADDNRGECCSTLTWSSGGSVNEAGSVHGSRT